MFKDIHKKTKILFSLAFVLAVSSIALYVGGYIVVQKKYSEVKELILQSKQEVLETKQLQSIKHLVNETRFQREKIDKYFVTADGIVVFIEKIESLGAFTGVLFELTAVDVINDNDNDDDALLLKFTTYGSWKETYYLLALIESLPYNIDIERVRVIKQNSEKGSSQWRGDFNIRLNSFINK